MTSRTLQEAPLRAISRTTVVTALGLLLVAPVLGAQAVVSDSMLRAASSAVPRCKITEIRRVAADTVYVSLIDSLLTADSHYEGEWRLCDGGARNQPTRDVAHAILRPLWDAWGGDARAKAAVLDIRSIDREEAHVRMVIWAPPPTKPEGNRSKVGR